MNALQSPIFIRSSRKKLYTLSWIILLKFENLLICINKMAAMGYFANSRSTSDVNDWVANIHPILAIFFLNSLWWIFLLKFENQLICKSKMAAMGSFAYSRSMWTLSSRQYSSDLRDFFFWTPSDGLSCLSSKNQLICISKMAAMG